MTLDPGGPPTKSFDVLVGLAAAVEAHHEDRSHDALRAE
jgi:hypothetical protein